MNERRGSYTNPVDAEKQIESAVFAQNEVLENYLQELAENFRNSKVAPPVRGWLVHAGGSGIASIYGTDDKTFSHFLRVLRRAGMVRAQTSTTVNPGREPIVYEELDLLLIGSYWKTAHDYFPDQRLDQVLAPLIIKTKESLGVNSPVNAHLARQALLPNHYEPTRPPKPFIIGQRLK